MALEAIPDSKYQFVFSSGVLNQATGGNLQPSSSDHLLQKDGQYQAVVASLLNASSVNLPGSAKIAPVNEGMVSGIENPTIVRETANFKLGSSAVQQISHLGLGGSQARKRKQQRGFTTSSPPDLQKQNSSLSGLKLDLCSSSKVHKKPRSDILQLKSKNEKQQKVLHSSPHMGGVDIEMLQQQQMRRHQLQQVGLQVPAAYALHSGVCSRRLMQYMYHLRHRPSDNGIAYWRKFVAEYYAPFAKKRWCLSLYDNVGDHGLGVFPKTAATDAWQCDICGSKSGRGFEANSEALPRLNKITFESGVIDELLYLDLPHERVQFSGLMILEYGKAVHEIVYEQFRVVREGKLRVIFTPDLKILSWEFCSWRHEEFLPRNLVAPQVNQLVQAAQKYQSAINCSGSDGPSPHDLQENCNINIELQLVDNLGFPKRYVRCLQIAEIVSSMKDLITFSLNNNSGPMESLKNYFQGTSTCKTLNHESQEKVTAQVPPLSVRTKLMASSPVVDDCENGSSNYTGSKPLPGSEEAMLSLGYYERLLRQNSFNLEMSKGIQEPSSYNGSRASSKSFQSRKTSKSGLVRNLSVHGLSSFNSSECNQKMDEHLIQKLLQETVSSRDGSEVEKVNHKTASKVAGLLATMTDTLIDENKVEFRNSTAAPEASGNAVNSVVGKFSSFRAASNARPSSIYGSDNFIKREQYLPEFIPSMVGGYSNKRISDGGGCDICYHRMA
ncbi:putative Transcriptional corepressor SEUSS [Melia azedarach]|uniref:Transcriptional corepressor SEUSS n=1 Tax=Melia azedarach TaxID=155640 RepID=A0ACC1XNL2_MELAZ|nr:putative Transcriptional corepressor SEUSS [Melia azedarach]